MTTILIQGAMDVELKYLISQVSAMDDYRCEEENGMVSHIGSRADKRYIIQKTGMGTVRAAFATTYALMRFRPDVVVNQGTAGAQTRDLRTGDVVLVYEAANINTLRMPKKKAGGGSDPFSWEGQFDTYYRAADELLEKFSSRTGESGKIIRGRVATGDVFSREDDRIVWLSEKFGTVCEDMETAAVYEVCNRFGTPCVGIRVISNNELLDEEFDENSAEPLQKFVWRTVQEL